MAFLARNRSNLLPREYAELKNRIDAWYKQALAILRRRERILGGRVKSVGDNPLSDFLGGFIGKESADQIMDVAVKRGIKEIADVEEEDIDAIVAQARTEAERDLLRQQLQDQMQILQAQRENVSTAKEFGKEVATSFTEGKTIAMAGAAIGLLALLFMMQRRRR